MIFLLRGQPPLMLSKYCVRLCSSCCMYLAPAGIFLVFPPMWRFPLIIALVVLLTHLKGESPFLKMEAFTLSGNLVLRIRPHLVEAVWFMELQLVEPFPLPDDKRSRTKAAEESFRHLQSMNDVTDGLVTKIFQTPTELRNGGNFARVAAEVLTQWLLQIAGATRTEEQLASVPRIFGVLVEPIRMHTKKSLAEDSSGLYAVISILMEQVKPLDFNKHNVFQLHPRAVMKGSRDPIAEVTKQMETRPVPRLLAIYKGFRSAVQTLAHFGVIHFDIKPDNLALSNDLPHRSIILDFGSAQVVGSRLPDERQELSNSKDTRMSNMCGSVQGNLASNRRLLPRLKALDASRPIEFGAWAFSHPAVTKVGQCRDEDDSSAFGEPFGLPEDSSDSAEEQKFEVLRQSSGRATLLQRSRKRVAPQGAGSVGRSWTFIRCIWTFIRKCDVSSRAESWWRYAHIEGQVH
ncbi:unnamed protein product [Amoebophrya sp. A25]|nr:unnamed protein product [Amoebophrya sp. A25]|eukprot:GSA25T00015131001.1